MTAWPLPLPPEHREVLAAFESLHEQWRLASEAAARAECELAQRYHAHAERLAPAPDTRCVREALQLRLRAQQLHEEAMRLLRDVPL